MAKEQPPTPLDKTYIKSNPMTILLYFVVLCTICLLNIFLQSFPYLCINFNKKWQNEVFWKSRFDKKIVINHQWYV